MPLSINFRWNAPLVASPEPTAQRNGLERAMQSVGRIGTGLQQRARQRELDRMAAEDRERRIAEEERQKTLYGQTAELIRRGASDYASLVARRDAIMAELAQLRGGL